MLDIPTKFDQNSIDFIKRINAKAVLNSERMPISHVYGSMSGLYSARETTRLGDLFRQDFINHLDELEKINVDFFYALNASCLGSLDTKELLKLRKVIEDIKNMGVKNFIVAHPLMLDLVRSIIPKAKIKASVILEIDDFKRFRFFMDKADIINISTKVNRNFTFLKSLSKYKEKVEFLCNEVCIYMCPYRDSHYTIESHRYKKEENYPNEYPVDLCYEMMTNIELLRARFILPEWIKYYKQLHTDSYLWVVRFKGFSRAAN